VSERWNFGVRRRVCAFPSSPAVAGSLHSKRHKGKIDIVKTQANNMIALRSAKIDAATSEEISRAISHAQENLLRQQRPDGH